MSGGRTDIQNGDSLSVFSACQNVSEEFFLLRVSVWEQGMWIFRIKPSLPAAAVKRLTEAQPRLVIKHLKHCQLAAN